MSERIEVFRGKGRIVPGWYYRLRAGNGQVLAVSESYVTHWNAKRAARRQATVLDIPWVDLGAKA